MWILRSLLSALLMAAIARAVPLQANNAAASSNEGNVNYRLPTNVKPTYYTIKLVPNIAVGDFYGETNIKIVVSTNETKTITLHAKGLQFDQPFTSLVGADNVTVKPFNQIIDDVTDFLTLNFSKPGLAPGQYTLNLKYNGKLNEQPEGFYRGSYINEFGEKSWFAASQFTPTHARRAFPCFDEPGLKAKFEIIIWKSFKYNVISNMPSVAKPITGSDSDSWTYFRITPVMSTYEVAFVISDFENIASDDNKFRFWSKRNTINMGNYAQNIAQQALVLLEDYTNFEYVLPTIDNVAIPYNQSDAKENWGLVIYPEKDILFQENVTTTNTKQDIVLMMSRELAKQWFSNLVSPTWWEYAWLNEGLPNFFQYFIADQIEMNWRLMDQFVIKNLQETAFIVDGIEGQHPLNANVNSPVEISGLFDNISSSKAGSIIRMFSHALGAKVLRTGLKEYVKRYAYATATSDDLFTALALAKGAPTNVNVKSALQSWVKQPGYPVITVRRRYYYREQGVEKEYKDHDFVQARYFAKKTSTTPTGIWTIPVTYTTEDQLDFENTKPYQWVTTSTSPGYYPGTTANKWVIYNKQQIGFYRVNYDLNNWGVLAKYLKTPNYNKIHVLNRAQLLDDSFNFVQSGHLSDHKVFLDISRYLELEDDYIPWYPAFRAFSVLNKAFVNTENYNLFKLYVLRLIEKLEKSVGYNEVSGDTHITKLARINAIDWACKMGSKDCNSAALEKLIHHVEGTSKISTDLRKVILCAGIRTANVATWDKTFAYYQRSSCPIERSDILNALGCSSNSRILKTYLAKTQNSQNNISLKDVIEAVITGSEAGVDVAMDFIKQNFDLLIEKGENNESILGYVNDIGSRMTIEDQTDKLERFINSLIAENADLAEALTKNALASALSNIAWLEIYETRITLFLQAQNLTENSE